MYFNLKTEVKEAITSDASLLLFLTKIKSKWFKSLITIVFFLVLMALINNYPGTDPLAILLANPFFYNLLKLYFILGSFLPLLAIIYCIFTIYFFLLSSLKGK